MKTARSRILALMIAAAIIVSFFVHWDEFSSGFRNGYNPSPGALLSRQK